MKINKLIYLATFVVASLITHLQSMEERELVPVPVTKVALAKKIFTAIKVGTQVSQSLFNEDHFSAAIEGLEGFRYLPVGTCVAYQAIMNQQVNPLGLTVGIMHYTQPLMLRSHEAISDSVQALKNIETVGGKQLVNQITSQFNYVHDLVRAAFNANRLAKLELCDFKFVLDLNNINLDSDQLAFINQELQTLNDSFQFYKYELLKGFFDQHGQPIATIDVDKYARLYQRWIAKLSINTEDYYKHLKFLADHNVPGFKKIYKNTVKDSALSRTARSIGQAIYILGKDIKEWVYRSINPDEMQALINKIKNNYTNYSLIYVKELLSNGKIKEACIIAKKFENTSDYQLFKDLIEATLQQSKFYKICNAHQDLPLVKKIYDDLSSIFYTDVQETVEYLINNLSINSTPEVYNLFFDEKGLIKIYDVNSALVKNIPQFPHIGKTEFAQQRLLLNQVARIQRMNDAARTTIEYISRSLTNPSLTDNYCILAQAMINALSDQTNLEILSCTHFANTVPPALKHLEPLIVEKVCNLLQDEHSSLAEIKELDTLWSNTLEGNFNALLELNVQFNSMLGKEYSSQEVREIFYDTPALQIDFSKIEAASLDLVKTNPESPVGRLIHNAEEVTAYKYNTIPKDAQKHDQLVINIAYKNLIRALCHATPYDTADSDEIRAAKFQQRYDLVIETFQKATHHIQNPLVQQKLFSVLMDAATREYCIIYKSFPQMVVDRIQYNIEHPAEFTGDYLIGMLKILRLIGELSGGDSILNTPAYDIINQAEVADRLGARLVEITDWYNSLNSHQCQEFWAHFVADAITSTPLDFAVGKLTGYVAHVSGLSKLKIFPQHGGLNKAIQAAIRRTFQDFKNNPARAAYIISLQNAFNRAKEFTGLDLVRLRRPAFIEDVSKGKNSVNLSEAIHHGEKTILRAATEEVLVDLALLEHAKILFKDTKGFAGKNGPLTKVLKHSNPTDIKFFDPGIVRGSMYEIEVGLKLIELGEKIIEFGKKVCALGYESADADIVTATKYIECKNKRWDLMDIKTLDRQIADCKGQLQKLRKVNVENKEIVLYSKHSLPDNLKQWLIEQNIKYFEG